ncbi:MAG: hypothetical protein ABSD63_10960 [Candidatus Korobacteraceae bacterium]|jgi:hypothetical protein
MKEMLRTLTTSDEVLERIKRFNGRYVKDWDCWLHASRGCDFQAAPIPIRVAEEFKRIMGRWQACGRYQSLRCATELQRTLDSASTPLGLMGSANLRCFQAPGEVLTGAIYNLWRIFEDGLCLKRNATELGVSKAILLLTKGRIGPAFDSTVKTGLNAWWVMDCGTYLRALGEIARDLAEFEARESTTLEDLAEKARRPAALGRAVDMVWGPRGR